MHIVLTQVLQSKRIKTFFYFCTTEITNTDANVDINYVVDVCYFWLWYMVEKSWWQTKLCRNTDWHLSKDTHIHWSVNLPVPTAQRRDPLTCPWYDHWHHWSLSPFLPKSIIYNYTTIKSINSIEKTPLTTRWENESSTAF